MGMATSVVVTTSVVLLGSAHVWAMVVEVRHVLGQHCGEMAAVEDQYPVQQLAAEGFDPSFGDRVRLGRPHRRAQDTNTPHWRKRHQKRR